MAIFNSNDIMPTNGDGTMPFKQNTDLFYLTGIDQEETICVIFPDTKDERYKEILFMKETNENIAIWEGNKLTKKEAAETSGILTVYWLHQFDSILTILMSQAENIYLNSNEHIRSVNPVESRDDRFRKKLMSEYPLHKYERASPIMHYLRAIKSELEIQLMQKACDITEKGFRRVLKFIRPGVMEYEIEAELAHEFLRNGSKGFAYNPIIASGYNSCVLHYNENDKVCQNGDVILLDVAAEYANYNSDLTRTVPVNGRFTDRQKQVYNAVLRVHNVAASMLRPGTLLDEYHREVGKIMEKELIQIGVLNKSEVSRQNPENPLYKKYFMHGTSHFLGLEVHDVGDKYRKFEPGMVFTCEPGIYIREESLGIRIENNLMITNGDPIDLMANIPIEVDEIEDLMNSKNGK